MGGRSRPLGAALLAASIVTAWGGALFAQETWLPPAEVSTVQLPERELSPRPKMSLAVGMGWVDDAAGFPSGSRRVPTFYGSGGIGEGMAGFDLSAFASSAVGRYRTTNATQPVDPVDRLALTASAVIRPGAVWYRGDSRYLARVLATAAAEFGLGFERDARTLAAGSRFMAHLGARVEAPLTRPSRGSELRLRLAASRNLGFYRPLIYDSSTNVTTEVGDTAVELFAALVAVF